MAAQLSQEKADEIKHKEFWADEFNTSKTVVPHWFIFHGRSSCQDLDMIAMDSPTICDRLQLQPGSQAQCHLSTTLASGQLGSGPFTPIRKADLVLLVSQVVSASAYDVADLQVC